MSGFHIYKILKFIKSSTYIILYILSYFIIIYISVIISILYISIDNLYKPHKNICFTPIFYKPIRITPKITDYPMFDLLCDLYKNCIFDCMYYMVVLPGTNVRYLSFQFLKIFLLKIFYINFLIFIKYIKYIYTWDKDLNLYSFLYLNFSNTYDERKLFFLENKWNYNPHNLKEIIKNILKQTETKISDKVVDEMYINIKNTIVSYPKAKDYIKLYTTKHEIKNKKVQHKFIENFSYIEDGNLYYITDYEKARELNWYGAPEVPLPLFKGFSKDSSVMKNIFKIIKQHDSNIKIPINDFTNGAWISKYHPHTRHLVEDGRYIPDNLPKKIIDKVEILDWNLIEFINKYKHKGLSIETLTKIYTTLSQYLLDTWV